MFEPCALGRYAAAKTGTPWVRAGAATNETGDITNGSALRAAADALLDPQVLLQTARDSSGEIVDFVYSEVNQATCHYLGMSRDELLGRGFVETVLSGLAMSFFPTNPLKITIQLIKVSFTTRRW